jgi:hypothetical protein
MDQAECQQEVMKRPCSALLVRLLGLYHRLLGRLFLPLLDHTLVDATDSVGVQPQVPRVGRDEREKRRKTSVGTT